MPAPKWRELGDGALVFDSDSDIRHLLAPARDSRGRGLLVHEYEDAVLAAPRFYEAGGRDERLAGLRTRPRERLPAAHSAGWWVRGTGPGAVAAAELLLLGAGVWPYARSWLRVRVCGESLCCVWCFASCVTVVAGP